MRLDAGILSSSWNRLAVPGARSAPRGTGDQLSVL